MALFAPKVFANDAPPLQHKVLSLLEDHMGLEVALYGYTPFDSNVARKIRQIPIEVKILHLWQQKISLSGLLHRDEECLQSLTYELSQAKRLGLQKAVIHHGYSHHPLVKMYQNTPEQYADVVLPLLKQVRQDGLLLHPENTFEDVHFHRKFFERLIAKGAAKDVGFCLDIGHTRVFSQNSLNDWLALVKDLHSAGVNVHYHIHVNRGSIDDHLTLCEGHCEDLLAPNPPWLDEPLLSWLQRAIDTTPNAIFCQEHPAEKATEAMWFFKELLETGQLRLPV